MDHLQLLEDVVVVQAGVEAQLLLQHLEDVVVVQAGVEAQLLLELELFQD